MHRTLAGRRCRRGEQVAPGAAVFFMWQGSIRCSRKRHDGGDDVPPRLALIRIKQKSSRMPDFSSFSRQRRYGVLSRAGSRYRMAA
jgi:hypothetical protein